MIQGVDNVPPGTRAACGHWVRIEGFDISVPHCATVAIGDPWYGGSWRVADWVFWRRMDGNTLLIIPPGKTLP